MGFGGDGSVIGGAQDNGTQYKDNSKPWSKEFAEVQVVMDLNVKFLI